MTDLFSEITVRNCRIRNRIVFPAMVVCDLEAPEGKVTPAHLAHYRWVADRGPGLIVTGAMCVSPDGRLNENQLGIWSDQLAEDLTEIPEICHQRGARVLMQIHHAGFRTVPSVSDDPVSSSDYEENGVRARALTAGEIAELREKYVAAAVRAEKAGFDGIELHCAHLYLLDQFFSSAINKRTDQYGGSAANRARFALEILAGIRERTGPDFIISCRMGCNTPDLEDAGEIARLLEQGGADLLDISYSTIPLAQIVDGGGLPAPEGFEHSGFVYGAKGIRDKVNVPVCAVWQIGTREAAQLVSEGFVDFVAVLRGMLVDPDWVSRARAGEEGSRCYDCRPVCRWYSDRNSCPGWQKLDPAVRLQK